MLIGYARVSKAAGSQSLDLRSLGMRARAAVTSPEGCVATVAGGDW